MLRVHRHGDVTRLVASAATSRLVGYDVSLYVAPTPAGPVLVDTGFPRAWRGIARWLDAADRDGRRLRGAVVTHAHEDHAGNVARLAARGLPLAMGAATRAAVEHVAPVGCYRRFTWGAMAPLPPDAAAFDPAPLALLPAPGHSGDHHVVWDADRRTLYGGDLFIGVKVRLVHPGEELRRHAQTLRATAALGPRRLFDAHRGLVEDPVPLLEAKAGWIEDTVARVERLLDAGWSVRRVRAAVLGREEFAGYFSRGDYSRANFVRAVRRGR